MAAPDDDFVPLDSAKAGESSLPRRELLTRLCALATGAAATLVPVAAGVRVAVAPLVKGVGPEAPFVPVANLEAVPADGRPRLFRVIRDQVDAWTSYRAVPIGAVYLRRTAEAPQEVMAFNTVCPHLGCFVSSRDDGSYHCPCHDSSFTASGEIGDPRSPSPRGLDRLATRVEGTTILVQFQSFATGVKERIPLG
jgi:Rieske Fe-S protein